MMGHEYTLPLDDNGRPEFARIIWNCRRGMKELEVVLIPFARHCYDSLDAQQQLTFNQLLGFDDASLYCWFMGYERSDSVEIDALIQRIQADVANLARVN